VQECPLPLTTIYFSYKSLLFKKKSVTQTSNTPKFIDLGGFPVPQKINFNSKEFSIDELNDRQKNVLFDLARIDKEIADTEFSLRVLKSAKNELSRLLNIELQS
jgi:hypothetical protein